jgi:hypothetical protein
MLETLPQQMIFRLSGADEQDGQQIYNNHLLN